MKKLFMILSLVLLLCFAFACEKEDDDVSVVDIAAERAAVNQAIEALNNAYSSKDVDALLALMADDVLLTRGGEFFMDKTKLREFVSNAHSQGNFWSLSLPEKFEVSASGDLAYAVQRYEYTRVVDGESRISKNSFTTVWKKQVDGSWKIVAW